MEIIAVLHGLFALFLNVYGFITKKSSLDYYYLFYIYVAAFSWTLYNGDCLITYYYNKQTNPSYQAGDFTEMSDLHLLFGKKYAPFLKKHHIIIVSLMTLVTILSMYRVFIRQRFSVTAAYILLSIYALYYFSIMNKMNLHALFFALLLGCLLYILTVWKSFVLI
jgi:hypothetical protein